MERLHRLYKQAAQAIGSYTLSQWRRLVKTAEALLESTNASRDIDAALTRSRAARLALSARKQTEDSNARR